MLCEKPLALTVEDVDRIAEAAARSGRLVLEAFMYRHSPRWLRAVDLVRQGALGDPRVVKIVFAFRIPTECTRLSGSTAGGGGAVG